MGIQDMFVMALQNILSNRTRSLLTMLGIIIGIASIIAIVSLGDGGRSKITGEFEKMGATRIQLAVNKGKAMQWDYINDRDLSTLSTRIQNLEFISPSNMDVGVTSSDIEANDAVFTGVNEQYDSINDYKIGKGRFFTQQEVAMGAPVAVIDEKAIRSLLKTSDPTGSYIMVGKTGSMKRVKIIGAYKAVEGPPSEDERISILLPYTFFQGLFQEEGISAMVMTATEKKYTEEVGNKIKNLIENRHHNSGKGIYVVTNMLDILKQVDSILGTVTTFVTAVAGISLVVGGIGVMNIMLVSVTERTREIGIRKALGANTGTILFQFLMEASAITFLGGVLGVLIGLLSSFLIGYQIDIVPLISYKVVGGALLFAWCVGLFFGIYPAKKAAQLDPIEALRYE